MFSQVRTPVESQNFTEVLGQHCRIIGTDATARLFARNVAKIADIGGNKRDVARQRFLDAIWPTLSLRGAENDVACGCEERDRIVGKVGCYAQAQIAASRVCYVECLFRQRESLDRIDET